MTAVIADNRLHEFISIKHLGIVADGVEDTTSEQAIKWAPAFENYTFTDKDGGTELQIDTDTNDEYVEIFSQMWPDALQRLKALAEA